MVILVNEFMSLKQNLQNSFKIYYTIIFKESTMKNPQMSKYKILFLSMLLLVRLYWYHSLYTFFTHFIRVIDSYVYCMLIICGIIIQLWRRKNISVIHKERIFIVSFFYQSIKIYYQTREITFLISFCWNNCASFWYRLCFWWM